MDQIISFTVTGFGNSGQGVHEVEGRIGRWPFARPMSYHIGINCDAIELDAGCVVVYRRGKPIARSHSRQPRRVAARARADRASNEAVALIRAR